MDRKHNNKIVPFAKEPSKEYDKGRTTFVVRFFKKLS